MCPLVQEMEANDRIESRVCLTSQHREMLRQVIDIFGIRVDYDLDIMREDQTLFTITEDVLSDIKDVLITEEPDIILVHGDTSTSFAAALAAFYLQIPVGHVEAGLRTYKKYSPFPEEINRCLTDRIADIHFAPTARNRENLSKEGITENVFVTGNTVIDAMKTTVRKDYVYRDKSLRQLSEDGKRLILVTAHRRENLGAPLLQICKAVYQLKEDFPDLEFVYPVHPNPAVRETVFRVLGGQDRIHLIDPLDTEDMHNLMSRCYLALTDSGGLQEEAPFFNVPALVLRTETERPEAVDAGTVRVVGVETSSILSAARELIEDRQAYEKMARAVNPYGDGKASERIVAHLLDWHDRKASDRTKGKAFG